MPPTSQIHLETRDKGAWVMPSKQLVDVNVLFPRAGWGGSGSGSGEANGEHREQGPKEEKL